MTRKIAKSYLISCCEVLDVLYGGLEISKLQIVIQKILKINSAVIFVQIFG